jgi:hypothetical protein
MAGANVAGLPATWKPGKASPGKASPGKASPVSPPFKFACDNNCCDGKACILPLQCKLRKMLLMDRILGAIRLAENAVSKLKDNPLRPETLNKFRQVFDQSPLDHWELPGMPKRKMPAGAIVADRFRMVAEELRTRETGYRCISPGLCDRNPGPEEPVHPTDTIVRDPVAWAALCKDEVGLCPPFWQLKKEWQEGTILHEMFHLCFGVTCAWFQHDSKERKRNNAYCYEAFALSVASMSHAPAKIVLDKCSATPR